jgi:hypothetical protein
MELGMYDFARPAVWVGGLALLVALACSTYVVWINGGSRNLGLGLGALFGACVLFALQLLFELQPTKSIVDFPAHFAADFQDKWIRKTPLTTTDGIAAIVNQEASGVMVKASPVFNSTQADKLTRDLAIIYMLSYLIERQFDWQIDAASYKTQYCTMNLRGSTSPPNECTTIDPAFVKGKLQKSGNVFAVPPHFLLFPLCLPPNSTLEITADTVIITNSVCEVSFAFRYPLLEMSSLVPLPDESTRYANVTHAIRATTTYFSLRAQDRKLKSYQSWASRIVSGVKEYFE